MRIGIVGTLNSRAPQLIRACNLGAEFPGHRVTNLASSSEERDAELLALDSSLRVHTRPADLIGAVDLVLVLERDGRRHRSVVEPFLRAGTPTFVDKPLATTREDADALVQLAQTTGTLLASWSALRFAPGVESAVELAADLSELVVAGPAAFDDPHAGLFFYGPHLVETALAILGEDEPDEDTIDVEQGGPAVVARFRSRAGVRVTLHFVTPVDGEPSTRHLLMVGERVVHSGDLTLPGDYNLDTLRRLLMMVEGAAPPPVPREMVAPVALLEDITAALSTSP